MNLKQSILAELESFRDAALSGQALAARFGVSRNAVWKAITALREDGYEVESTPNRGYRLAPDCDRLSQNGILTLLPDGGLTVHVFDTLDSTNNEAKRRLAGGEPPPFLIAAEEQTAGRGRQGRFFFSPKGAGLYLTVALAPGQAVESVLGITAYAAVTVSDAISRLTGQEARIKWVNDLYLDGKKICGILTEAVTDFESGTVESLLVGVGVNLKPADVPAELQDIVGTLAWKAPIKNRLAAEITNGFLHFSPGNTAYINEYRARSVTLGRRVECAQGKFRFVGVAEAIDASGALVVRLSRDETRILRSGEARILDESCKQ
jgi:BirA family transcriptional regulator, biotin operon repressor / biotin---[acetyl-CoA-carboxylase] ligase